MYLCPHCMDCRPDDWYSDNPFTLLSFVKFHIEKKISWTFSKARPVRFLARFISSDLQSLVSLKRNISQSLTCSRVTFLYSCEHSIAVLDCSVGLCSDHHVNRASLRLPRRSELAPERDRRDQEAIDDRRQVAADLHLHWGHLHQPVGPHQLQDR